MATVTPNKPGSAVERAKQLNINPKQPGVDKVGAHPVSTPPAKKSATELRARLALAGPMAAPPSSNSLPRQQDVGVGEDLDGSVLTLRAKDVLPYDKNPRTSINPKYHQIKSSIKAEGRLNGTLVVTRRPGTSRYMLYGGGNTRLAIVNELFDETGDPNFEYLTLTFRRWKAESSVIAAHLIENEARGDTSFWEKAKGLQTLKEELEREAGRPMATSALVSAAKDLGMDVESTMVRLYLFALDRLEPVGIWLSKSDTDLLRKRITSLSALASRLGSFQVDIDQMLNRCLMLTGEHLKAMAAMHQNTDELQSVALDVTELCNSMDSAIASALGHTSPELRQMLSLLDIDPKATPEGLKSAAQGQTSALPMGRAPKAPARAPAPSDESLPSAAPPTAQVPQSALDAGHAGGSMTASSTHASGQVPRNPPSQQMSLQPAMLAPVVPAPVVQGTAQALTDDEEGAPGGLVDSDEPTDPNHPLHISQSPMAVRSILTQIAELTNISDLIYECQDMPLGYFMELPSKGIEMFDGKVPATNMRLRKATWHVLASLSGQFDERHAIKLPENTLWRQLVSDRMPDGHPFSTHFQLMVAGAYQSGWHMPVIDFHEFMWHQTLGHLYCNLLIWAHRWRQHEPARFHQHLLPIHPQKDI
jgi:ParB family protein of integrating conjugative element (PFGI_1 class)